MKAHLLSDTQSRTLQALIDTLLPPDDWPGGWDAGVGDYLLRQFDGDLRDKVEVYAAALDLLDGEAAATSPGHIRFADLSPDERTELLTRLESGATVADWPFAPAEFITMAASHAAEGFYSDPGNGGNRDGVAWRMIGFEVRG